MINISLFILDDNIMVRNDRLDTVKKKGLLCEDKLFLF